MPDIVIPINKTVDISKGTLYTTLGLQNTHDQLIQGQSYANVLNVSVYDGAEPVALSGGCMGYFVRQQDGSTVTVAGTISGNVASVEFPSFVYDYTGLLTITLNVGGTSLVQIATTVRLGTTMVVVDPGNALPNLDEIQQIMLDVENALNQLSGALEASQAATQAANEAASAANTAASALNGLTATANTLEPDEPATAVAELVSGAWKITFGIPQGVQGIQGVRGTVAWHGTAITGTSTTPTAYPTGIDSAIAGDLYLYSGTDVANIGNVYTCTQGGDASTALWAYMANWRGATGAGSVSSVNSVLPNADGDVKLDGLIYPTTAQALEAMSQEQQAALYAQGYRAIKTENNGTVVLLGLASDGSLEWLGCNQPHGNLLDNSDFVHPVAQAGVNGAHGATGYAVDRWMRTSGATVSQAADGMKIVSDKTSWTAGVQQQIEAKRFADVMTFAVRGVFPVECRLYVYIGSGTTNFGSAYFQGDAAERTLVLKLTKPDGLTGDEVVSVDIAPDTGSTGTAAVVRWAALYEGSYTVDTLPPYVPKGYAQELAECRMYFQHDLYIRSVSVDQWNVCANSVNFPVPMRTSEYNVVFRGLINGTVGVCEMYKDGVWNEVDCGTNDREKTYLSVVCPNGGLTEGCPVRFRFDILDDL